MAAILTFLPKNRAEITGRVLTREVIEALGMIESVSGVEAFDDAARHLLLAVSAVVAHREGCKRLHDLLDLIETVNAPELVQQRRDEFKD